MPVPFNSSRVTLSVVELLRFKVVRELGERYIQKDTANLDTDTCAWCSGFLGKEVWLNLNEPTEVVLVIRWATQEQWKSISPELLEQTEKQFAQQLREVYSLIESSEYQVRKFPYNQP